MNRFDDGNWPVVRVFISGPQTRETLENYLTQLEKYLKRGERFAVLGLSEASGEDSSGGSPGAAKRQMNWMQEHAEQLKALMAGMASVASDVDIKNKSHGGPHYPITCPFPWRLLARKRKQWNG